MSASVISYAGGILLALATIPQAVALVRHKRAHDFGWLFTVMNFAGLALLAWRSYQIREWAFFGVNVLTTTFWGLVLAVKITTARADGTVDAGPAARPL